MTARTCSGCGTSIAAVRAYRSGAPAVVVWVDAAPRHVGELVLTGPVGTMPAAYDDMPGIRRHSEHECTGGVA